MNVFKIWHVLCVLGFVVASLCVNEIDEGNYADNYDNEISEDQQEGEFCFIISFVSFVSCLFEQMTHHEKQCPQLPWLI